MKAGTAQSFLESSLTRAFLHDDAVVHDNDDKDATGAGPCSCCCRCGRYREWKQNGARGTRRSKSHTSLRTGVAEITSWDWEPPKRELPAGIETAKLCGPGEAPLERLPVEILGVFMSFASSRNFTNQKRRQITSSPSSLLKFLRTTIPLGTSISSPVCLLHEQYMQQLLRPCIIISQFLIRPYFPSFWVICTKTRL